MENILDNELPDIIVEVGKDIDYAECPSCGCRSAVLYEEDEDTILDKIWAGTKNLIFLIGATAVGILITWLMNPELVNRFFN